MAPGMKTHSDSSFDETKELSILRKLLESKKSIKTYFKENDKTPNHDGFFELVNTDTKQPKKQFIVQIKKVDTLRANQDGSFSYSFDTPFLFYVKKKVVESPAIIFIVELNTEKCFYKYLSDSYLMNLDFEEKEEIALRLYPQDQITNIDSFYKKLLEISIERNAKFLNKTQEQIEEMRDAIEWLNKAMEDMPFLKEMIPNFWRFGIAASCSYPITVSFNNPSSNEPIYNSGANAFGLYLQRKNELDYGVQEFSEKNYIHPMFDFENTITPLKYVQEELISLLEMYFNSYIIHPKYLSDDILNEIAYSMLDKMAGMRNCIYCKPNTVRTYYKDEEFVKTAKAQLGKFFSFFRHIINDEVNEDDKLRKQRVLMRLQRPSFDNSGEDLIELVDMFAGEDFKTWNGNESDFNNLMINLKIFNKDYSLFCLTILELEKRGIEKIKRVWDVTTDNCNIKIHGSSIYSIYDDHKLLSAFKKLLLELPKQYDFCYEKMLNRNNSFKYLTDVVTKVVEKKEKGFSSYNLTLKTIKFDSPNSTIIDYDERIPDENIWELAPQIYSKKIISTGWGMFPIELFETRQPLYNAIKVLLWQGITAHYELDSNTRGVFVGNIKCKLF